MLNIKVLLHRTLINGWQITNLISIAPRVDVILLSIVISFPLIASVNLSVHIAIAVASIVSALVASVAFV